MLSHDAIKLIDKEETVLLSSMSIWEVGVKIKTGKLDIKMDIQAYLRKLKMLNIQFIPVNEEIWVKNLQLNWEHRDPTDRTIVATALAYSASIVTKDEGIIHFYPQTIC